MAESRGGPRQGRPEGDDHRQAVENILARPHVEAWVRRERERLTMARGYRRAWLLALGLRPVERMTIEEVRRIASFQRMLDAAEGAHVVVRKYGAA
jgi:hypothetical protein